jgi:hypothetical protein
LVTEVHTKQPPAAELLRFEAEPTGDAPTEHLAGEFQSFFG